MKYGVVDMGTNTIRLGVYQCEGGGAHRLLDQQKTVGLGGYVVDGALSDAGIQAACRALGEYTALLDALEVDETRVFATASLRKVHNGSAAALAIQAATGLPVEILTGEEEANLSFQGTLHSSLLSDGLLVDIGGGSTELVVFRDCGIQSSHSLPLGSLSLFKHHVSGLFPTPMERREISDLALREVSLARGSGPICTTVLGAGGTLQSTAQLLGTTTFSAEAVYTLLKGLQRGERSALLRILEAVPERVHTILPGLIVLSAVLSAYGAREVAVGSTDIRDGFLHQRMLDGCNI